MTLATPTLSMNNYVSVKMAEVTQSCEIKYGNIEKGTIKYNTNTNTNIVEPLYCGHNWDRSECLDRRGVLISECLDYRGVHISECPNYIEVSIVIIILNVTHVDSSLKNIVSCMSNAAVKFDMLGTDPRKTVSMSSISTIHNNANYNYCNYYS